MSLKWLDPLDPDEQKWYSLDWRAKEFLAATEIITASSWALDPQVAQLGTSFTTTVTSIKLTGGTGFVAGRSYNVSNTIDTLDGANTARYQRTVQVKVKEL